MTLVLEESEDVSLELLTPILASLKKCNEVANYKRMFPFHLYDSHECH